MEEAVLLASQAEIHINSFGLYMNRLEISRGEALEKESGS